MFIKRLSLIFILNLINSVYPYYGRGACSLPKIAHGTMRVWHASRLVKFSCSPTYSLVGEKYAVCRRGKWDLNFPVCVKSGCTELPAVPKALQLPSHNNAWVVFFCLPGHQLVGSPALYCDGKQWNSTAPACVATKTVPAMSCDFEDENICGWKQDDLQDFTWTRLNKKTPSYFMFTGPSHDHTYGKGGDGYYMYIETTSRLENDTARLLSPIYDASVAVNGCFSFFYHMYGKDTGGLRVYQKPDKLPLSSMLNLSDSEKEKYLLFEQWGNQGEYWYSAVNDLTNFSDDFQIVIEGIRGASFTSDTAIDDVSILHGDDCVAAKAVATTPYPDAATTCADRCDNPDERGCSCQSKCLKNNNCCADFVELCIFTSNNTDSDDQLSSITVSPPQTEKLIARTTEPTTPISTTTSSTTTTSATTSSSTSTSTSSPTSPPTTTRRTTVSVTPVTIQKVTTLKTTNTKPTEKTTIKFVGTNKTTVYVTTTRSSTYIPKTTRITPRTRHESINKKRKEEEIETRIRVSPDASKTGRSTPTVALILVGIALCACTVFLVLWARGSRGRATLARLQGRVTRDPEVRYLSADVDD